MENINLFISYAHDDEPYFKIFNSGLKRVVENAEHFKWSTWDDTKIHVGTFWDAEIKTSIKDCNVALLLVSVGFMASKYIRENEYNEFMKRYKEKGILVVPIVFAPCDFNRWEDLSKLQFYKPNGSAYEKAGIENFTYADLIKFKETDGTLIPNPNINRYHLDLVKKIEDSFMEFLKQKKKTVRNLEEEQPKENFSKLSDYPKPNILFTGRKNEIKDFKKAFDSFRIFSIEGLGGTGKTQFAAKCIQDIIPDKSKVIWLNGSAQSNFDVFVETAGYGDVLKGEKKSDLALYSGFKALIEKDERVIFWDNYNDYEDPSFAKFLSFANTYLQKSTIILITKTEPIIDGITLSPIILEGLEDDAIEYAKKVKVSNPRYSEFLDSDLEKICKSVDGHPLAIELSMSLMHYGKSANDIVGHMAEFSGIKKVEEFSKRLFLDIFNHQNTSDEERKCFLVCSVFKERIKEEEIKFLYNGKDVFALLAGLIEKLLISFKEGYYEMHPLVRSFSYEILVDKNVTHKKAAEYFITQRTLNLNSSLEEKIFYHLSEAKEWGILAKSIENLGGQLIQQGQLGLLADFMTKLTNSGENRSVFEIFWGDINQIKSEYKKALFHYNNASQSSENNVKAEGMVKYGEILYRSGDYKESLPYFEKAYEFAKKNKLLKEEARALNDIGLICFVFGDFDTASEKYSAALKIRLEINDKEGLAASYNNLGNIFAEKDKFERAISYLEESKKICIEISNKIGLALYYSNLGGVLRRQNKLDEALEQFNLALRIGEEIEDKELISTCLNSFGLILIDQNLDEEALLKYNESLKIREEIGDKHGIATSYNNLGAFYWRKKEYNLSLEYFFKSLFVCRYIGSKHSEKGVLEWIWGFSKELGKEKFKELLEVVYKKLDSETKKHIHLTEFSGDPIIRMDPKIGRNDPCPCGSGKKYKKCHGK